MAKICNFFIALSDLFMQNFTIVASITQLLFKIRLVLFVDWRTHYRGSFHSSPNADLICGDTQSNTKQDSSGGQHPNIAPRGLTCRKRDSIDGCRDRVPVEPP